MFDIFFVGDREIGTHVHICTIYGDYYWYDDREDYLVILTEISECYNKANSSEEFEKLLNIKVMKCLGGNYD